MTTQKLKFWQNSITQSGTKLYFWKISIYEKRIFWKGLLVRTFWHLDNRWDVLWAAFCDSRDVFLHSRLAPKLVVRRVKKDQWESPCCGSLEGLWKSHSSNVTPLDLLDAEKTAEAVLLNIFWKAFTAILF